MIVTRFHDDYQDGNPNNGTDRWSEPPMSSLENFARLFVVDFFCSGVPRYL